MMSYIDIGIDPGLTGAIGVATTSIAGAVDYDVFDMPVCVASQGYVCNEVDGHELHALLRSICSTNGLINIMLERTSAAPGQGVTTAFSMGVTRGIILGVTLDYSIHQVAPATWKAYFGLTGKDKATSLRLARSLFPALSSRLLLAKDHNRAEALLLAEYMRLGVADERAPKPRKRVKQRNPDRDFDTL